MEINLTLANMATVIRECTVIAGVLIPIVICMKRVIRGARCQLRSEMLRIYYHNREAETIRQFEYENFVELYGAYKSLKGNSFIDKIYKELQSWEIVT